MKRNVLRQVPRWAGFLYCCFAGAAAFGQTITSIGSFGPMPNSENYSYANGVSADGGVVVGFGSSPGGERAFRWTPAGVQSLGVLPGGTDSRATGVSADGAWTVGYGNMPGGDRAFRVLLNNPLADLGITGAAAAATDVSADGTALAIDRYDNFSGPYNIMRWTTPGGSQALGSNGFPMGTLGISGDGSTVVGYSGIPGGANAIQWTQAGGLVTLTPLVGGNYALARAASQDGSFIAGNSNTTADPYLHVVRWYGGVPQDIGVLPGYTGSYATAIHNSGLALGGDCIFGPYDDAWVWTQPRGMVLVSDYLLSEGVDLTGWSGFHTCMGISNDGTAIVGTGTYQGQFRAFVARGLAPLCGPWIVELTPTDIAVCLDGTTALVVTAYSPSEFQPSIQWQKYNGTSWVNLVDGPTALGTQIAGVYSYVMTLSTCNTDAVGIYRAEVWAGCSVGYSPVTTVTVNSAGANIVLQPVTIEVCPEGTGSFSVNHFNASVDVPFSYQWQREAAPNVFVAIPNGTTTVWDGNVAGIGGVVSGANTANVTIAADTANSRLLAAAHYLNYRCVITNACASVPSTPAGLKVWESCQQADINGDDVVDFFDIDPFLLALFDPPGYAAAYPNVNPDNADCNNDDVVDFFDIDPFLACLFGACP